MVVRPCVQSNNGQHISGACRSTKLCLASRSDTVPLARMVLPFRQTAKPCSGKSWLVDISLASLRRGCVTRVPRPKYVRRLRSAITGRPASQTEWRTDTNNFIYHGNMEQDAISFFNVANGTDTLFVRDSRINWVDTFSTGFDGYLYFTVNQLVFSSGFYPGTDRRQRPFSAVESTTAKQWFEADLEVSMQSAESLA